MPAYTGPTPTTAIRDVQQIAGGAPSQDISAFGQANGSTSNTSAVGSNLPEFTDPTQQDAWALLDQQLADWGLTGLEDWGKNQIVSGYSAAAIGLNLTKTQPYIDAFGKVIQARADKGLTPMTPAQILDYRTQAYAMAQQFGVPKDVLTKDTLDNLMIGDVSATELGQRIQDSFVRLANADDATKQAYSQLYGMGVTPGEIASMALSPQNSLPVIERRLATAEIGGQALNNQLTLSKGFLEQLAAAGESKASTASAFATVAKDRNLLTPLTGETHPEALTQEALASGLLKNNPDVLQQLQREQEGRQSPFQAKGSLEVDQSGRGGGVVALRGSGV